MVDARPSGTLPTTRCASCGHDITGLKVYERCPACGEGVLEFRERSTSGRMCLGCGYPLDGLPTDGVCPECATPVIDSLRGPQLRYASSEYLRTLHRGVRLILLGIIVWVVATYGGLLATITVAVGAVAGGVGGQAPGPAGAVMVANALLVERVVETCSFAASCLVLAGWWMFTERDPAGALEDRPRGARTAVRVAVIFGAVTAFGLVVFSFGSLKTLGPMMGVAAFGLGVLDGLAQLVRYFASLVFVRRTALRIPDRVAADRAKLFIWLCPLIHVGGYCVLYAGPLVAAILYWLLLNRFRRQIKAIRVERGDIGGRAPVITP